MGLKDWIRVLLLALSWGSAFFLIKLALRDFEPLTIVLIRVSLAAAALHVYCRVSGQRVRVTPALAGAFLILGLLGNALPFSLIAFGQTQIASSLTAILIATTPLFTVLAAHLWGRAEQATPARLAGVTIGLLGVAALMGLDTLQQMSGHLLGQTAMLCAAISYATSAVFGRRFRDIPPAATATGMLTASTVLVAPFALLLEAPGASMPGPAAIFAVLSLALISTVFAYILYFTILANAGSTNAMLVTLVQPPVAILLGTAFLGETLEAHQFAGFGLIATGLLLVDGRAHRLLFGIRARRANGSSAPHR